MARCTIERLMRAQGLRGMRRDKTRKTTMSEGAQTQRPADLVERQFVAGAPNQLWVADLTYVRTHAGWTYAAFVTDVYSRRIVGWRTASTMPTDLPLDALEMALWTRQRAGHTDNRGRHNGLTQHSDAGAQYTAIRYTERLAQAGALASIGTVGDSYHCETVYCHQAA